MYYSQHNKKIGIFGLGKTGTCAYKALTKGLELICYDDHPKTRQIFIDKFMSKDIVDLSDPRWRYLDQIVLSPGVPQSHQIFQIARDNNIDITSDVDILFAENKNAKFISITGTNGKSTTTALIGHILASNGYDYPVGGNIGVAPLSLPLNKAGYVLELSSFQLELISSFNTKVAVLLNITPDHLDRHGDMEGYIKTKEKLLHMLSEDGIGVIGVDNEITRAIYEKFKNKYRLIPISAERKHAEGVSYFDGRIHDNFFEKIHINFQQSEYLQGVHNRENIVASFAACRILGLSWKQIVNACSSFRGLPHRMQYLGTVEDISFYNDSKATNADAASKSIGSLNNIYWLAGGILKEGGIESLKPLSNRICKAYLFGRDKDIFATSLNGLVDYQIFETLEDAFAAAFQDAILSSAECNEQEHTKNILLAPASSSYDQFRDFEERGEVFMRLCQNKTDRYM